MITLTDLQNLLERIEDPSKAAGLKAFIKLAENLPPNVTVLGKIQKSFVALGSIEELAKAKSFEEVCEAIGPQYDVKIEPVGTENRAHDKDVSALTEVM